MEVTDEGIILGDYEEEKDNHINTGGLAERDRTDAFQL